MRKSRVAALLLCLVLVLGACGTNTAGQTETATAEQLTETAGADGQSGIYVPGTYTASAQGKNGLVTLSVTFSADAIESIDIVEHQETEGVSDGAFDTVPAAIVQNQSLGVDVFATATVTSNAILEAVADCVTQAGGDAEALKTVPVEVGEKADVLTDSETDVLVIGGGGAGMAAALSAAENGAKVILIEKQASLGGTTILSSGSFNHVDPDENAEKEMTDSRAETIEAYLSAEPMNEEHAALQAALQEQWDAYQESGSTAYFNTPESAAMELFLYGSGEGNAELILNFTRNANDTYHWAAEVGGVNWEDKGGARIINGIEAACLTLGVEIYTNTRATELLMEDGQIVGAVATNANGESVTIQTSKGVVLATGGFSANAEMRSYYNTVWEELDESLVPYGSAGSTGDGIVMAEAVGANLVDMGFITLKCESATGQDIAHGPNCYSSSIYVNQNGERFIAEEVQATDEIGLIKTVLAQPGQVYYMITDFAEAESRGYTLDDLAAMVEGGYAYSGETVAELAEAIGADPDTLEATVASFNESVDTGEDEFGRELWVNKIETGPYYAVPFIPYVHSTLGGVQINTSAQVLDTEGNVIPGLFAAGEVTGDIHGRERMGGNTIAEAVTYGRIAGASAAAN